jgi:hypothetical protein
MTTQRFLLMAAAMLLVLLSSCASKDGAPRATIRMRDGTTLTGAVLSSSATEIRVAGDDNVTRTIPMTQVRSVDYGDATQTGDEIHDQHYHPPEAAITSRTHELPVGTQISVRNEETIDSARAVDGQTFAAEVTKDIRDAAGDCVIPRGANAQIVIRSAAKGGKIRGASDLILDLGSVSIDGRQYRLTTTDVVERGRNGVGANKRTVEFAGGGAAVGAIIGAIAGGGKGAAIGGGSGAGAGALTEILTKGASVKVPVESILTFRLESPLVVEATEPER